MSANLIAVTGLIYLYVCLEQTFRFHDWRLAVVYFGYALGNVGLYAIASKANG